jgi:hypothetical protein
VAGDLGEVLVRLSRDKRLRQLTSGAGRSWRDRSFRSQLDQLLSIDWPAVLDGAGYHGDPPAERFRHVLVEATAAFVGDPTEDSYDSLRNYLFDLGTRLLDDADEPPLTERRRGRLARAIGRGLLVVGTVGLAATVAGLIGLIPPAGLGVGAAVYVIGSDVVKDMAKSLVEQLIPKPKEGIAPATREALEFDERATILSDLLKGSTLGRLRRAWQSAADEELSGDDLREMRKHTLAWCSAADAATLTMRSLGAALWNGLGDQTLERLAAELAELRAAVNDEETEKALQLIHAIHESSFNVQQLLEQQAYRNHP